MPESPDPYIALLRESGCRPKVIAHCRAVCACAGEYARKTPLADPGLVTAGALLHDIGRGRTHSISHAQEGADILREKGFPERLVRIVECHTGAGLTADECTLLGLLPRDCMPQTIEEKIVTHADNLIAGSTRVTIDEEIAAAIHLPKKIRRRMYRLANEVELLTRPF
ncbi:HD domain-containing protein [Methanoregula sp.]|uniref:HD domain-containing protein n=1 Tax=Methanoregula sp. TaxID=2052170 RepID=UPI002B605799|nr:HD domain-containing protein [Methanoregula sp.]HVP96062.1 HD domain-containing protein [Methanoregula sp.]